MKKQITDFKIVNKKVYNESYFAMTLQHPSTLPEIEAGQFVEVEIPGNKNVMLRRPIILIMTAVIPSTFSPPTLWEKTATGNSADDGALVADSHSP